mgnify:CR=1 FL=1
MNRFLLLPLLILLISVTQVHAKRYALVIGNGNYGKDIGSLDNPVNDANDMAALLKKKQFSVIKLTNANQREMERGISRFTKQLNEKNAVGLFFFAGHGVGIGGRNYLIPLGANINGEGDVKYEAVDAERVMSGMQYAGNNLNMVILDACRNNPFARSFRSASRGLNKMDPPKGSLILYATSPGEVAADGAGRNGMFTQHLLKAMNTPNYTVEKVFKATANKVYKATNKKQLPWQSGVMLGDFYFTRSVKAASTVPAPQVAASLGNKQSADMLFWDSIKDETDIVYFNSYLKSYPQGTYAQLAKLKIQRGGVIVVVPDEPLKIAHLTIKSSPENVKIRILNIGPKYKPGIELKPGRYHIEVTKRGYQRHTEWLALAAEDKIHSVSLIEVEQAQARVQAVPISKPSRSQYEPDMVKIKGGCYQMGSPSWEKDRRDNERSHQVCVDKFQMGKKEVTVGEFKQFIRATGYRTQAEQNIKKQGCYAYSSSEKKWAWRAGHYWNKVGFSQNNQHPVVCVSWNDIQSYIAWLNKNSTGNYRLPTEAEWEYAARGGSNTAYFWGDEVDSKACRYANVNDKNWASGFPCDDGYKYTAPVGQYRPNAYGLYDISGNVWEWTCSEYEKGYNGKEKQCLGNNHANNSAVLAVRGGSFNSRPRWLRLAHRDRGNPWSRDGSRGFRLARTY